MVQWLRLHTSNAGDAGLIPGQGIKILHAARPKKKKTFHREQTCGCQGGGGEEEGWTESLGLVDANYYI